MTISDLLAALRRFRLLAVALFLLIVGIGVGSVVMQASRYESAAVLTVTPKGESIGFEAQQTVQFVIPPILTRLGSSAFAQSVRDRVRPRFRTEPIEISASNDPGTSVINLAARSSSREAALDVARVAVGRIMQEPRSEAITIQIVNPAAAATSVKASQAPRIIGGALLLGLIVAVLTAAAAHRLRPVLPRAEAFRERYGHEVLGEIPQTRDDGGRAPAETVLTGASTEFIEAFRSLEARLTMRIVARGVRDLNLAIAVTSWGERDGKSTVATSLAQTLAVRGRRVTLVDCDMRRPSAHAMLGVPLSPGVADIAEGRPVLSVGHETTVRPLEVIPAGTPDRHPAEVLHDALPRVLAALQNRTVIVDTPPMFTAEATAIVGEADAVVLVADYRTRSPEDMAEAIAELELSGTPILGVVLNRVTARNTAGRDSYAYQTEKSAPHAPTAKPQTRRKRARAAARALDDVPAPVEPPPPRPRREDPPVERAPEPEPELEPETELESETESQPPPAREPKPKASPPEPRA